MASVEPPSRVSIVAQLLRALYSGKSTPPASQRPKNIKSPFTKALRKYVETLHSRLVN